MQDFKRHNDSMGFFDGLDDEDEDTMLNKYMTFIVGNEVFGIAIQDVVEIIEMQKITDVPDMPVYVKGVINLRGKIIPVIDLRLRFNLEAKEYNDRTCIIITDINQNSIGFIVDTVEEVLSITPENIAPPPDFKTASSKEKYIKGLGKVEEKVKILLDVQKLLFEDELNKINNLNV